MLMPRLNSNIITSVITASRRATFFAILLLLTAVTQAGAQISNPGAIEIEKGGKLWIEGSAKVVDYSCHAQQLSGNGNIENTENPKANVRGDGDVSITVSIPVHSLDCGKKPMNRDMYEALKADRHPQIRYTLLDATLVQATPNGDWMNIKTTGIMEIAGVQDTTEFIVEGQLLSDNRFRVRGSKQINMKTYDIEPPTALLGLIKASTKLTVHFDVTVRLLNS